MLTLLVRKYWFALPAVLLAIGFSLFLGQDASWDLRNYHYYNPHAWITNRGALDIAPAQMQSYFSPFADTVYYKLVKAGFSSGVIGAVLAIPVAISLFFLGMISVQILPPEAGRFPVFAILVLAATGSSGFPVIGTTISEWHVTALFTASIWIAIRYNVALRLNLKNNNLKDKNSIPIYFNILWFICGFLGGAGVGLKLTGGSYAIGLALMCLSMCGIFKSHLKYFVFLCIGGVIGFIFTFSYWGFEIWSKFGNPLFPIYNNIFKSPMASLQSYVDARYAVKSIWELLSLPYRLMSENWLVSEMIQRDWRLALGLSGVIWLSFSPVKNLKEQRALWLPIFVFCISSYLIWAGLWGIYRYAETLEIIMSLSIISCVMKIIPNWKNLAVFLVSFIIIITTKYPDWGRLPHGKPAVLSTIPDLPSGSMVVIASVEPISYIVPSLPPEIPVISLINNFMKPGQEDIKLQNLATERVLKHNGSLWLLAKISPNEEKYYDGTPINMMLKELGLLKSTDCKEIISGIDGKNIELCKLFKVK